MAYCEYCKKEIPYSKRKSHECDEYYTHLDNLVCEEFKAEQDKFDARLNILSSTFTIPQAEAIVELVTHMITEENGNGA